MFASSWDSTHARMIVRLLNARIITPTLVSRSLLLALHPQLRLHDVQGIVLPDKAF